VHGKGGEGVTHADRKFIVEHMFEFIQTEEACIKEILCGLFIHGLLHGQCRVPVIKYGFKKYVWWGNSEYSTYLEVLLGQKTVPLLALDKILGSEALLRLVHLDRGS
jgi:hypothetical protein